MPSAPAEVLERGAVCLALYPFALGFPLQEVVDATGEELLARVEQHPDIDSIEKTIEAGAAPKVVTQVKLRRVLLLQTGTNPNRQDIMVARISHVSPALRDRAKWYERLRTGRHPTAYLLDHRRQGVSQEAYLNVLTVTSISKSAILRRTGSLNEAEMREISERLVTALEIDISEMHR